MIKLIANMGVSAEAPKNTLRAFQYSASQKYEYFSVDPAVTLDGVIVAQADGVDIFARTYKDLAKIDIGSRFSPKFSGETVTTLEKALTFAKENDMIALIKNGFEVFDEDVKETLFDMTKDFGKNVAFICTVPETVEYIAKKLPEAEIHYDGIVASTSLPKIKQATGNCKLVVRITIDEQALAPEIKKYASLCVININNREDYDIAISLGADIVETNGFVKHDINRGFIPDMHSHTENSHDANAIPDLVCRNNIARGVHACAFTDHSDGHLYGEIDINAIIGGSVRDALAMREKYQGKIDVLTGVELGESIWHGEIERELFSLCKFDAVLGSVHTVRHPKDSRPFAQIDFSTWTDEEVDEFLTMYFDDLYETVTTVSCDIMSHLTVPFRYVIGKAGKKIDIDRYMPKIKQILRYIIDRGIAFEINTSGIGSSYSVFLPDEEFITLYRDMGGYMLTIGSDAHNEERVANGFPEALALVKKLGFTHIYLFKDRTPIQCTLV